MENTEGKIKFKAGDRITVSDKSDNVYLRGLRGTIIRFLAEENHAGSFYQWYYEVMLEDGTKSYVPQWEMESIVEGSVF